MIAPPPLSELTTLRLGGPPARLVDARTEDELVAIVREADAAGEPLLVLAGGSNVVVADEGFGGTVARVATRGIEQLQRSDGRVWLDVQAGEEWDPLVSVCVDGGLAGIEALSGIPGSVGATPIQNVGAYGQEVSQIIASVRAYDRQARKVTTFAASDCGFAYRHSRFKGEPGRSVVLEVTFQLALGDLSTPVGYAELARTLGVAVGDRCPLSAVHDAVLSLRRRKGMVLDPDDHDTWSAGSFFTNPILSAAEADRLPADAPRFPQPDGRVKSSAAWLIDRAGFSKGYQVPSGTGAAALSTKHTLALTNRGHATTSDLLDLAREVRAVVREEFGITLVNEPVLVGCEL